MPIYEFTCNQCGNRFEYLCLSSSDDESVQCPACQSQTVTKMLSAFACHTSASQGGLSASAGASCTPRGGFS